jgi:hypothetical protein
MAPNIASSPIQVLPNSTKEVDEYMDKNNMDETVISQRSAAGRKLRQEKNGAVETLERNRDASISAGTDASSFC